MSNKISREELTNHALDILYGVWQQINWDKVDTRRRMNIYDEFSNKVKASSHTTTSFETFVEKLARKMEVRSLKNTKIIKVYDLSIEEKVEILKMIREETLRLMLKLRLIIEEKRDENGDN